LQIASQTNNPDALESYLQQYPDTSKRAEILSKIDSLRRAEFTEWTMFDMVEQKYPQFLKLSSIGRFGDRAVMLVRQAVSPAARQLPIIAAHPDAMYGDDLTVYDCRQPASVIADETLIAADEKVLYHYRWGDPRYVDFTMGLKIAPGMVANTARSIACYQDTRVPVVTKSEIAKMSFESLSSTATGDGEYFYKVLSAKPNRQNVKQLLFITKFSSEHEVPHLSSAPRLTRRF
jgi:hypothetical protein